MTMYTVTFTDAAGEMIKGKGETVLEALQAAQRPLKIVTKMMLRVTDGKRSYETSLPIPRAKRMFYPFSQRFLAKDIERLMKGAKGNSSSIKIIEESKKVDE